MPFVEQTTENVSAVTTSGDERVSPVGTAFSSRVVVSRRRIEKKSRDQVSARSGRKSAVQLT